MKDSYNGEQQLVATFVPLGRHEDYSMGLRSIWSFMELLLIFFEAQFLVQSAVIDSNTNSLPILEFYELYYEIQRIKMMKLL